MSQDSEYTFDYTLLPHNQELYNAFELKAATWDAIVSAIKKDTDPMKRPYFVISDPSGRLFNAIPIVVDVSYNVLFQLTYKPDNNNNKYFWWDPVGLDSERYSNDLHDSKDKFIVSKKLQNYTKIIDSGTSEVICFKNDKWQRKIYLGIDTYPFSNGNNDIVFDFYIQPNEIDINQLPVSIQELYADLCNDYLEFIMDPEFDDNENDEVPNDEVADDENAPDEVPDDENPVDENPDVIEIPVEPINIVDEPKPNVIISVENSNQDIEKPADEKPVADEKSEQSVEVAKPVIGKSTEQAVKVAEQQAGEIPKQVKKITKKVDKPMKKVEKSTIIMDKPAVKSDKPEVGTDKAIKNVEKPIKKVEKPIKKVEEPIKMVENPVIKEEQKSVEEVKPVEEKKPVEEEKPVKEEQAVIKEEKQPIIKEEEQQGEKLVESDIDINQYMNDDIIDNNVDDSYVKEVDVVYYAQGIDDIPATQLDTQDLFSIDTESVATVNFPQMPVDKLQKFDMESVLVSTGETYNPAQIPEYKPNTIIYPTHIPELGWLNDHSEHSISMDNMEFPTVSHYYNYMKFIFGLKESEINKDILSFAYKKIINTKSIKLVKQMTCEKGDLRHFMKYFDAHEWDKKKDNILFYGRLFKIKQHPELQAELLKLKDNEIYRIVKNVGNIPRNKLNRVLGPDIYWEANECKWYGGNGKDQWNIILNIVQNGNLSGALEDK
jgi:predicted NAD-dependent protein-ADP-ribosyltransferase YbiA (DUF1768 family)